MTARLRRFPWVETGLAVWTGLVFAFLFAPIVTAALYSFNRGVLGKQTATFTGFTTRWYRVAWENAELRHDVAVSLEVAVAVAVIATVLGTSAGIVLARPNEDGTWETRCVFTLEEGAAFLGLVEDDAVKG